MNTVDESLHELRVQAFRLRRPLYQIGADIGVHPTRLGAMLAGRIGMPAQVRERFREALENQGEREVG